MVMLMKTRSHVRMTTEIIDRLHQNDPAYVAEYALEIVKMWKDAQIYYAPDPDYMKKQSFMKPRHRELLVDWLVDVQYSYGLQEVTLHTAVSILDRFLSRIDIQLNDVQLVGSASLYLAIKYEETNVLSASSMTRISDGAFTRSELVATESKILRALNWELGAPTRVYFVERWWEAVKDLDDVQKKFVLLTLKYSLQQYDTLNFLPDMVAAATLCMTQVVLGKEPWTLELEHHTGYAEKDLYDCIMAVSRSMIPDPPSPLKAVKNAFSRSKEVENISWDPLREYVK
jgi:hypothetical protein